MDANVTESAAAPTDVNVTAAPVAEAATPAAPVAPAAPSIAPEELKALQDAKAAVDARNAAKPENADKYALALPEDVKLPEGVEVKFDDSNPAAADFKAFAHEAGLSQAEVSKLLGIWAKSEGAKYETAKAAQAAETEKVANELKTLGDNAQQRVTAAVQFLEKALPGVHFSTSSADGVKAIEALMQKVSGPVPPGVGDAASPPKDIARLLYPSMTR